MRGSQISVTKDLIKKLSCYVLERLLSGTDVGCLSVHCEYVLLPFDNKQADLTNSQEEQSQTENQAEIQGEERWS